MFLKHDCSWGVGGRKGGREAVLKRLLKEMTVQAVETEKKNWKKFKVRR